MTSCACIAGAKASTRSATASERDRITGCFGRRGRRRQGWGKQERMTRKNSDSESCVPRPESCVQNVSTQDAGHRTQDLVLPFAAFAIALALRLLNLPYAFDHGRPVISPLDELYHWKRISFSALHFPRVLELDPDRGDGGAFCPWPPLYDLTAGGAARLLGARDASGVLARVVWFPPVVFAAFVAAAVAVLARACGAFTAIVTGVALAAPPFLVTTSWIGSIDHHFLEPILVFGILWGTLAVGRWPLAVFLTAAMFVQTALVIAAGLSFAV